MNRHTLLIVSVFVFWALTSRVSLKSLFTLSRLRISDCSDCGGQNFGAAPSSPPFACRSTLLLGLRRGFEVTAPPGGAATQRIAPPTRVPAGRGPTDARHSRCARARGHHGHRAATVTPQLKRLMLTEMEDQPRAARRARRGRGARAFPLGAAATPRDHACSSHLFLSEGPPHRDRRERAACHRPDLEATIRAFSHR